ncbi:hypothetical protein G9A89_020059, partial [Geosiphon pyriformis]
MKAWSCRRDNLVGSFAGALDSSLAGLGFWSGSKKIKACVESVYLHGPSYKKMKLPNVSSGVVDLSAGPLSVGMLHSDSIKLQRSWSSEVDSEEMGVSEVSNVKDLENTVAEEISYVDPNTSETNEMEDDATLRKTSTFTSESSLNKAKLMAVSENIIVNSDLKKVNICSDWEVIIKKIPVDLPKSAIEVVFFKFGVINSIKIQLIGLWQKTVIEFESTKVVCLVASKWSVLVGKDSVRVALAVDDKQTWVSRDYHQALLYTLLIGITAHELVDLLESYGEKTCFIGHNPSSYACNRCAIICFENETSKLAAFGSVPVFKRVSLHWAGLSLAHCAVCKQYGHISEECSVGRNSGSHEKRVITNLDHVHLASIYKKKQAPVTRLVSFGGRTWASVIGAPLVHSSYGAGLILGSNKVGKPLPPVANDLKKHLFWMSAASDPPPPSQNQEEDIVMGVGSGKVTSDDIVNTTMVEDSSTFPHVAKLENMLEGLAASVLSLSAHFDSLVLAGDMNILAKQDNIIRWHRDMNNLVLIFTETKLKDKTCLWLATKFDGVHVFFSGLNSGYVSAGVAIVMNNSLAKHVCKVSEVTFKNKLSVSILGLYASASLTVWFFQAAEINSLIVKAVNESSFVIFGGNFNEDGSHKCASFKKCHDLGLINSLGGVVKTIDYVFVSSNLANVMLDHCIVKVSEHFDTNHKAVSVDISLNGLLDFDVNNINKTKWSEFKGASAANATMFSKAFVAANRLSDLDAMWDVIHKVVIFSANKVLKKRWFRGFDDNFTKKSFRFHKLELLVSKLVKASCLVSGDVFALLLNTWVGLDSKGAFITSFLFLSDSDFDSIHMMLVKARKSYHSAKLLESKCAEESQIKQAIERRMESFEFDKGHTIRIVLEWSFHKVVLNHLVTGNDLVKSKFQPLDYVFDGVFSGVMCLIGFAKMFGVILDLPNGKMASFSGIILDMLVVLLNSYLDCESVSGLWKEAWVLMILKPYKWEGVLMNTRSIALIKTAHKILSKIFSDQISLACSTFDVLHGDNFSVLKGTTMQSLIFAIELWLVLQDMHKMYDSVGWKHLKRSLIRIKMCDKFIRFFGSIYNGCYNRIITDFGLSDSYHVHDGLDQGEKSVCGYRLNSYFISKTGLAEFQAGLTLFLAAGVFVNDTIWVGSSQTVTQHIFNVASDFFRFNDISINNDKTVAIPINCRVVSPYLTVSELPISIAKKGKSHCYLGIFLSSKGFSKPSLAKAYLDIHFFVNLVLKKTVLDKQFMYLVSAVLFSIVNYRIQFSFILGLKSKAGLPIDFSNDMLHYPSLYGLKTFEQIQAKSKSASVVAFVNSVGVLGCLFSYRSFDLQALSWHPYHSLLFPVCISVTPLNNFLVSVIHIFSGCDLSLDGFLVCAFHLWSGTPMSLVLSKPNFVKCVFSLQCYEIVFRLDPHSLVLFWFDLSVHFLNNAAFFSVCFSSVDGYVSSDIHQSYGFGVICGDFLNTDMACLSTYIDESLISLGTVDMKAGTAVFFKNIDLGLGVRVSGLVFSTLMELQAIVLALECVLSSHSVDLFSDIQAALDACKSESLLVYVNWVKVKGHLGVLGNEHTDVLAKDATSLPWWLPHLISKCFLRAGGAVVSSNSKHFVRDVFQFVYRAYWEIGSSSKVVADGLCGDIDWSRFSLVWHPDFHMMTGFISIRTAGFCTYFMKCLYNRDYSSVICLFCDKFEVSDHVFSCSFDADSHVNLLDIYAAVWEATVGLSIAIMKKVIKESGSGRDLKLVLSRKKRKGVVLKKGVGGKRVLTKVPGGHLWGFKTGDTTKSESINIEKECLIEKTTFNYGESKTVADEDHDQTSKGPDIKTKKALGKPLGKIDFSDHNNDNNNVLLDVPLEFPPFLKNLVTVSVRKSFALDIDLNKVVGKSSYEKLMVIRKLFSKVNGFGRASTPSKFLGIIHVFFTSESSLVQTTEKARVANILVNTNLKKSTSCSDWAVIVKEIPVETSDKTVCAALSEFGSVVLIKMQLVELWQKAVVEFAQLNQADLVINRWLILIKKDAVRVAKANHRALLYILPIGTNVHDIWDFIGSVGEKTCARCAVVCFDSTALINAVMRTTSVLKDTNLCWSYLNSAKCNKYGNLDHTSLSCFVGGNVSPGGTTHRLLSDDNKSRLVSIYARCSALISHLVFFDNVLWTNIVGGSSFPSLPVYNGLAASGSFSEIKPTLVVSMKLNNRFVTLKHSLASLMEHIDKLAKRLDSPGPMVFQLNSGYQPLVTPSLQNQGADIVISEGLSVVTNGKAIVGVVVVNSSVISKMEKTLNNLSITIMGLSTKIDNADLVPAQENVVYWHIDSGSMVSIIMNKFDGVKIFSSGLDKKFLGTGMAIIMNNSLVCHVSKIEEILGRLVSVQLLFKGKLSILFLGLYADVSTETRFGQACKINAFIAKTANSSMFVVLGGDFNKDKYKKSASFKFCSDLELSNFQSAVKVIDYIFVSKSLSFVLAGHEVTLVSDFFNTNHNAVLFSVGLDGFLDAQLN